MKAVIFSDGLGASRIKIRRSFLIFLALVLSKIDRPLLWFICCLKDCSQASGQGSKIDPQQGWFLADSLSLRASPTELLSCTVSFSMQQNIISATHRNTAGWVGSSHAIKSFGIRRKTSLFFLALQCSIVSYCA